MENVGDVLICGAGPVGLLTAIGLARRGIRVTVIDGEPAVVQSPRATGYFPPTLELIAEFGFYEDLSARAFLSHELKLHFRLIGEIVDGRVVFNIAGNKYRLVVWINYTYRVVYMRFVGTHRQYDNIDAQTV